MGQFKWVISNGGFLDLDSDDDVAITKGDDTFYVSRRELLDWLATLPPVEE